MKEGASPPENSALYTVKECGLSSSRFINVGRPEQVQGHPNFATENMHIAEKLANEREYPESRGGYWQMNWESKLKIFLTVKKGHPEAEELEKARQFARSMALNKYPQISEIQPLSAAVGAA